MDREKNFASLSSYFSCRIYTSFGMASINSKKWHKPNLPITAQVICCPMQVHRVYRLANHKSDPTSSSSFPPRGPRVRTAFFVQRGLQRTLSWALEIGKIAGVKHQGTVCAATFLLGTTPPQQARAVRAPYARLAQVRNFRVSDIRYCLTGCPLGRARWRKKKERPATYARKNIKQENFEILVGLLVAVLG